MDKKQLILKQLKTKAHAFGFSKNELESVAADLADNLKLEENASEEDANEAVEKFVDSVLPFFKISQSAASRAIQAFKDAHPVKSGDDEPGDDDESGPAQKRAKKGNKVKQVNDEEPPAWAQKLLDRIEKMEGENITDKRQSKLEKLLENTGSFRTRTLKSFRRMKFDTDDEFDEFLEEVQADLDELNQERANDGLSKLGSVPPAKSTKPDDKDVEVMSDDELDKLASQF